ncbi:MAG TPA: hypothetical protein VLL95_03530, partial [Phnomibacter sp.]|nr:hypothetical protein [Phnomibacter sp.]
IFLDKNVKDKWGLPVLAMDVELKDNELKMRQDMMNDAAEMLEAAGIKDVRPYNDDYGVAWAYMKWEQPEWVVIPRPVYSTATTRYGTARTYL